MKFRNRTPRQFLLTEIEQEHYDCDECESIFADEKNLDSHHCGCHEENESILVSAVVCEETFECDKWEVVFVDKTDLRTHMIGYHVVLKQWRFCPFKFSRTFGRGWDIV